MKLEINLKAIADAVSQSENTELIRRVRAFCMRMFRNFLEGDAERGIEEYIQDVVKEMEELKNAPKFEKVSRLSELGYVVRYNYESRHWQLEASSDGVVFQALKPEHCWEEAFRREKEFKAVTTAEGDYLLYKN